jgi:hypothetical protein
VGPRAVLDAVVKRKIPSPRRESNPGTSIVQPVAQRYTALTMFTSGSNINSSSSSTTISETFFDKTDCSNYVEKISLLSSTYKNFFSTFFCQG